MNDTRKLEALRALYARLPKLACQRRCQECCGPVTMTRLEMRQLAAGRPEVKFDRAACETEGGFRLGMVYLLDYPVCPFLKEGACSAYDRRPFICRLWGLTEKLRCPHGCQPERVVTEREAHDLIREATLLGF